MILPIKIPKEIGRDFPAENFCKFLIFGWSSFFMSGVLENREMRQER